MYDIKNLNIWKTTAGNHPANEYRLADIAELCLSVRSYNCLRRAGCSTIGDIEQIMMDEGGLRRLRNLGDRSEKEILEKLDEFRERCRADGYVPILPVTTRTAGEGCMPGGQNPGGMRNPGWPGGSYGSADAFGAGAMRGMSGASAAYAGSAGSQAAEAERQKKNQRVKKHLNTRLEDYALSEAALTNLRNCGVRLVRDLYTAKLTQEPGWYAVRELFQKIKMS